MPIEAEEPTVRPTKPAFKGFGFGNLTRRIEEAGTQEKSASTVYNALMRKVDQGDVSSETKSALEEARQRLLQFTNRQ